MSESPSVPCRHNDGASTRLSAKPASVLTSRGRQHLAHKRMPAAYASEAAAKPGRREQPVLEPRQAAQECLPECSCAPFCSAGDLTAFAPGTEVRRPPKCGRSVSPTRVSGERKLPKSMQPPSRRTSCSSQRSARPQQVGDTISEPKKAHYIGLTEAEPTNRTVTNPPRSVAFRQSSESIPLRSLARR
jgi:hypothetical protein